jgi:hypothetical protein
MDPVPALIWLSSVAGATMFFSAGRFSRRAVAAGSAPPPLLRAEREEAAPRRAVEDGSAALDDALVRAAGLAAEVVDATLAQGKLERELEELRQAHAQAAREASRLHELAGDHARREAEARAEIKRLTEEAARQKLEGMRLRAQAERAMQAARAAEAQKARAGDLEAELAAEKATADELRAALDAERTRAGAEAGALRRELEARASEASPRMSVAEAQRASVELALRGRVLDRREHEIERREAEDASLRQDVERLSRAHEEANELRRRVGELEARAFALAPPAAHEGSASGPPSARRPASCRLLEAALEERLEELRLREGGCRTAVVSDMSGLLLASSGDTEHGDSLAAGASITAETAERLRQILPIGEPVEIRVTDRNHVFMTARWLHCDEGGLLLGTLGVAGAPADHVADTIGASISDLIRAA